MRKLAPLAAVLLLATVGLAGVAVNQEADVAPQVTVELEVLEREFNVFGVPFTFWTFNGVVPAPVIRVTQGTELTIVLRNGHTEPHSVHTHFQNYPLAQDGSSHSMPVPLALHQADDPTSMVGPISAFGVHPSLGSNPMGAYEPESNHNVAYPGQAVTYTFKANEVGSFVYHCHVFPIGEHMSRGLVGVIIVYPPGWTWQDEELQQLPENGNTDARIWDPDGNEFYEDVVVLTELDLTTVADKALLPNVLHDGKARLVNFRTWADPYYIGPVPENTPMRIVIANLGEEMHTWHMHAHNFNVIDKFDPQWDVLYRTDALVIGPGQSYILDTVALTKGFWFSHDHSTPNTYAGMLAWLRVAV